MDAGSVIAIVAVILSALTFVATQFGGRHTATMSYVQQLEVRVERLEQELAAKTLKIQEQEELIIRLTQKLIRQ